MGMLTFLNLRKREQGETKPKEAPKSEAKKGNSIKAETKKSALNNKTKAEK